MKGCLWVFFAIILVLILLLVIVGLLGQFGILPGGSSSNRAEYSDTETSDEVDTQTIEEPETTVHIVLIEDDRIYLNAKEMDTTEDLKVAITQMNAEDADAKYSVESRFAIKETYDEVTVTLSALEEVLGIQVEYQNYE